MIESISAIKLAALRELFTDDPEFFPQDDEAIWWEVWLRHSDQFDYENFLRDHAEQLEMRISEESIRFLDRTVILVYGTKEQLTRSIRLLSAFAEVRRAKETSEFYTGLDRQEQRDWINNALARMNSIPCCNPLLVPPTCIPTIFPTGALMTAMGTAHRWEASPLMEI